METPERIILPAHRLNFATTRVEPFANGIRLAHGTGFVLRYRHHYALVTAWHVLTGRDAFTNELKAPVRPDSIRFNLSLESQADVFDRDGNERYRKTVDLPLYDEIDAPVWTELNGRPYQVDIGLILLDDKIPEIATYGGLDHFDTAQRNEYDLYNTGELHPPYEREELLYLSPRIRSDLFVLGFPKSIELSEGMPIWKRASVASEPHAAIVWNGIRNEEIFYADGLTKGGMSGGPVVHIGKEGEPMWTPEGKFYHLEFDNKPRLIGIYAGRDGSTKDENEFAMARVWKAKLLVELFQKCLRNNGLERNAVIDLYPRD